MPGQSAAAPAAARFDDGVADLARVPGAAPPQPAVEDQAAADAGADPDPQHVVRAPARPPGVLGQGADVGVVVDVDGDATQPLGEQRAEGDVVFLPPRQVRRLADDAGFMVDGARRPDPHPLDTRGAAQVLDDLDDRLDDRGRASVERCLALGVGLDLVAVVDDSVDLRAAQVDPDPGHSSDPPPAGLIAVPTRPSPSGGLVGARRRSSPPASRS